MLGKFIVIEGCDFTGKSTQIKKIASFLREQGVKHITTREPGGTVFGEQIRELIFGNGKNIDPITEILLFMASRNEHMSSKIMPMLSSEISVVCDRYFASTFVYQSILRNIPQNIVVELQSMVSKITPDLTIILDMQPDEILARMEAVRFKGFNSYDSKELSEITQIRNGFIEFAEKFGTSHNVVVVNANQSYENVSLEILTQIKEIFNIA